MLLLIRIRAHFFSRDYLGLIGPIKFSARLSQFQVSTARIIKRRGGGPGIGGKKNGGRKKLIMGAQRAIMLLRVGVPTEVHEERPVSSNSKLGNK